MKFYVSLLCLDFNRHCANGWDSWEMASQQSQQYSSIFLSNDGTYHWSQKGLKKLPLVGSSHFELHITWILMKIRFCRKYQSRILKLAYNVAFGLNNHEEKSFWKISCLFTFLDKSFIFEISSILTKVGTKICSFINSECCIMTKRIN